MVFVTYVRAVQICKNGNQPEESGVKFRYSFLFQFFNNTPFLSCCCGQSKGLAFGIGLRNVVLLMVEQNLPNQPASFL